MWSPSGVDPRTEWHRGSLPLLRTGVPPEDTSSQVVAKLFLPTAEGLWVGVVAELLHLSALARVLH